MASEKQIAANKRNAAKSTGPSTPEGKARSRMDALRHGSSSTIVRHQKFVQTHLKEETATVLNTELTPVRQERMTLLAELEKAISRGAVTPTKLFLRKLRSNERKEQAIVRSIEERFSTTRVGD